MGLCVEGLLGTCTRPQYDVLGPALADAFALCSAARPGDVLVRLTRLLIMVVDFVSVVQIVDYVSVVQIVDFVSIVQIVDFSLAFKA